MDTVLLPSISPPFSNWTKDVPVVEQNIYTISAHGSILDTTFIIPKNITFVTLVHQGSCYSQNVSNVLRYLYKDISEDNIQANRLLNDLLNPKVTSAESLHEYALEKNIDLYEYDDDLAIRTHLPCTKMSDMNLDFLTWYDDGIGSFIPGIVPLIDIDSSQIQTNTEFEDIRNDTYIPLEGDQSSRRAVNELFCVNNDISKCVPQENKKLLEFFDKKYITDNTYSQTYTIKLSSLVHEFLNNPPGATPRVYIITSCRSSLSKQLDVSLLRQRSNLYAQEAIGISCENTCYLAEGRDKKSYCFLGWDDLQKEISRGLIDISTISIVTEYNATECIKKCGEKRE
jgi:hypothetical protein